MNKLIYLLLFCCVSVNADQLSDQIKAFDNVQQKNEADARDYARVQAEYARQQDNLRQAAIKEEQKRVALQEQKAMQERAAANRAAEIKAQIAQDKSDAIARAQNEERLKDKTRAQAQEDEEREYIKQQSALKIEQEELETQRLKAKADLEAAIANDRIKSVAADTALARKKETTEIDVVQSGADVNRTVAEGIGSNLSGLGNEGLYKFLVVISLIILVLLVIIIIWLYSSRKKSNTNANAQAGVNNVKVSSNEKENK